MKLGDLIKKAFIDAGQEPPVESVQEKHRNIKPSAGKKVREAKQHKTKSAKKKATIQSVKSKPVVIRVKHNCNPGKSTNMSTGPVTNLKPSAPESDVVFDKQFDIKVEGEISPAWIAHDVQNSHPILLRSTHGSRLQIAPRNNPNSRPQHEIRIGLDFGTSTVKVVIGDSAMKKTFAVQFREGTGISSYLLPTRLYITNGEASLYEGSEIFQDLKLRLIDSPDDEENLLRVTLYLGLVLRYVRDWLAETLGSVYQQYELLWSLVIGLPSNHVGVMEQKYRRLSLASWMLSCLPDDNLSISHAKSMMSSLAMESSLENVEAEYNLELEIIPEIAAQVYGYVNSDGFDPRGKNLFLMADVGGSTVDAALFRVSKIKGKSDFQFYTTTVEPTGVHYLHEYRLGWWQRAVLHNERLESFGKEIADSLSSVEKADLIPGRVNDYFSGVSLTFNKPPYNPDNIFYRRVINQIRGNTFVAGWKNGHWSQEELKNTPFYLCGGGSRSALYRQLINDLKESHGYSCSKTIYRRLVVPGNLEAPGLLAQDYDRLSVAYGLSLGGIGSVIKELPKSIEKPIVNDSWKDNYIDASML